MREIVLKHIVILIRTRWKTMYLKRIDYVYFAALEELHARPRKATSGRFQGVTDTRIVHLAAVIATVDEK